MTESLLSYNGKTYRTNKEKIKADLEYIASLHKKNLRPFYGIDGKIYLTEKDFLLANRAYLQENIDNTLKR